MSILRKLLGKGKESNAKEIVCIQTQDFGAWKPLLNPKSKNILITPYSFLSDYGKLVYVLHELKNEGLIDENETETIQILSAQAGHDMWGARCELKSDKGTLLHIVCKDDRCSAALEIPKDEDEYDVRELYDNHFPHKQEEADGLITKIRNGILDYSKSPA